MALPQYNIAQRFEDVKNYALLETLQNIILKHLFFFLTGTVARLFKADIIKLSRSIIIVSIL